MYPEYCAFKFVNCVFVFNRVLKSVNFPDEVRKLFSRQKNAFIVFATTKVCVNCCSEKFSRLSGSFTGYQENSENIQNIWNLSRISGNFPGCLETFRTIRKFFRPSGNFPYNLDTFLAIQKLSGPPRKYPDYLESL